MGKHKFKLSDMIPNAWFYKLKDMNKTSKNTHSLTTYRPPPPPPPSSSPTSTVKTTPTPETQCQSRKSYHITRELTIDHLKSPPRKSKSSSKSRKSTRRSSSISSFSSQSTSTSLSSLSKSRSPPSPPSCEETDVVKKAHNVGFLIEDALLKVKKEYMNEQSILDRNALPELEHLKNYQLPPIITKQQTQSKKPPTPHNIKEQRNSPPSRRLSVSSPGGMRLKINSPKLIARKQGQNGNRNVGRKSTSSKKRRSISESFAVVKSSFDPQRDFKESMVEMIVQNNLTAAKDLEDLLTCYLTLNLDEYHDVIIKVFKQIWCDFRHPT